MPSLWHRATQTEEQNWVHLFNVTVEDTPKWEIQESIRAAAHAATSWFFHGTIDSYTHLVELSTAVSRSLKPCDEEGRGAD
jgi:hypothetical protein